MNNKNILNISINYLDDIIKILEKYDFIDDYNLYQSENIINIRIHKKINSKIEIKNKDSDNELDNMWVLICFMFGVCPIKAKKKNRSMIYTKPRHYFYVINYMKYYEKLNHIKNRNDVSPNITEIGYFFNQSHSSVRNSYHNIITSVKKRNRFNNFYERYKKLIGNE
jgi:hypothetical protein